MVASILVVDDEEHILQSSRKILEDLGYECKTALNGREALRLIPKGHIDIIITDIRMPNMDGMALLKEIKAHHQQIDVIVITGFDMEYSYVDMIEAGATDFLAKPFHRDELQAKVKRILNERELKAELLYLSIHDSLTELFNRHYFYQKLLEEVERAKRQKRELSLIIMDIDNFKEYNDTNGHIEGDKILATLGQILMTSFRQNVDSAFRYGGDEFAVLLIETDFMQAARIADRVRKTFKARKIHKCSLSLGVAQLDATSDSEELLRRADEAMYSAKRAGGNRVEVFSDH
jgi:two-component system cell cycle response regulator